MSDSEKEILLRALAREKAARKQSEIILEQKSAELFSLTRELKESNFKLEGLVKEQTSQLRGVFENIIDAYVVMDLTGNVLKMNDAATELFEYDLEDGDLNVVSLIYREDIEYAMTSYDGLMKDGYFTNYKSRIFTKNKHLRWVHINASLIYDDDLNPIAAQGIVRDITEAESSAALITEQQNKLAAIVDYSTLGIILTQDGAIIQTNRAAQELMLFSEAELLKLSVKNISIPDDFPASKEFMDQMNSNKLDHFVIKKRYKRKDNSHFWARTNVAAVRNRDGSIKYQVALIEDITEQLKSEEERQKLLGRLERSNHELEEYAHIVSHDLKSPLRSIYALVDWVTEDNRDTFNDESNQNMTLIRSTLAKMDQLISDVLEYSSLNSEGLSKRPIDINELMVDLKQHLFIPDHISIKVKQKLPVIMGDEARLQQLFQNLIQNAIRYIDKDEGLIEIDVKEKKKFYQFAISDNGIGIADEYHEKIFQIFQSLKKSKESTGIGLSIVKKIVNLYQGDIWLESKVGEGTTFYFTLRKI